MAEIDEEKASEQFAKKARQWQREDQASYGDEQPPEAHKALMDLVGYGLMSDVAFQMHALDQALVTPLQKMMGYALLAVGYAAGDQVVVSHQGKDTCFLDYRRGIWTIEPSVECGGTWADFRLHLMVVRDYDDEGKPLGWLSHLFVLCDDEDTYEKNKARLRRDRQAEKKLRASGCDVMRFEKSEVWADPVRCAAKAYEHVKDAVMQQMPQESA